MTSVVAAVADPGQRISLFEVEVELRNLRSLPGCTKKCSPLNANVCLIIVGSMRRAVTILFLLCFISQYATADTPDTPEARRLEAQRYIRAVNLREVLNDF